MPDNKGSSIKKIDSFTLLLILAVAAIGIIAVFALGLSDIGRKPGGEVPAAVEDQQIRELEKLSDSDELDSIEADLNSTNVDNLDQGLNEAVNSTGDF